MDALDCLTCGELDKYAANAPYIRREGPAKSQDDLRRSVMPRGHDRRVILVIKGGAAKIYHLNVACPRNPHRLPAYKVQFLSFGILCAFFDFCVRLSLTALLLWAGSHSFQNHLDLQNAHRLPAIP